MASEATTHVLVRVVFEMHVSDGPWGDDATAGQMRKMALDKARETAASVVGAAAQHAYVRLSLVSIGDRVSIVSTKDKDAP